VIKEGRLDSYRKRVFRTIGIKFIIISINRERVVIVVIAPYFDSDSVIVL
jgi:hypothetical protein